MPVPQRTFRLVIQRVGDDRCPSFRVVAYREAGIHAHSEFHTLRALIEALEAAVPDVVLDLQVEGSIIFAREIELDDTQLRTLGLA